MQKKGDMGQPKQKRLAGRERWRVAVHEGSHAVAMNHYDMLDFVTIDEELATRLLLQQDEPVDIGDDTHRGFTMAKGSWGLREFCVAVTAGPEGESLLLPVTPKVRRTWASDAFNLENIAKKADIKPHRVPALAIAAREEWHRLAKLHNWKEAITRVAEALLERQTLTAEDVARIVKSVDIKPKEKK
jgi:hypothetical protein